MEGSAPWLGGLSALPPDLCCRQPPGRKRDGLGGRGSGGKRKGLVRSGSELRGPSLSFSVYLPKWFICTQAWVCVLGEMPLPGGY